MGLFTKTRTYTYVVYSPVMGDSYNTTVKYGNRREKVPLDVITTREMLALHGQGLNSSSKMKAQLKQNKEKVIDFLLSNVLNVELDLPKSVMKDSNEKTGKKKQ